MAISVVFSLKNIALMLVQKHVIDTHAMNYFKHYLILYYSGSIILPYFYF